MNRETSHRIKGPQRNDAPFVMHLERVCRIIDMGAKFGVVEFNPYSDLDKVKGATIKDVGLRILDGGDIAIVLSNESVVNAFGLKLSNYKSLWRCWQNGVPTDDQRRATQWRW